MSDGRSVPVLMVHGWTGRATHAADRKGTFSHLIDLTANQLGTRPVPRSLVGQLQAVGGTTVYTFDYHRYSGRWVTDPSVGAALGAAIDCLYAQLGERVIVVGHSMGGLAARQALASPRRVEKVSRVITFGTPHTGSLAAAVGGATLDAPSFGRVPATSTAVVRTLLAACGLASSRSVETGSICDGLPAAVRAFDGEAGRALRSGSPQLRVLPFPDVPFHALGGDTVFDVPVGTGWFGITRGSTKVSTGDLVVLPGSATHRSADQRVLRCEFAIDPARVVEDQMLTWTGLRSKAETRPFALAAGASPCAHWNLMRSIELTNEALGLVADDVRDRRPTRTDDLLHAPVPALCATPAGRLDDGRLDADVADAPGAATWIGLGDGTIADADVEIGELDGRPGDDAAVAVSCNLGGVPWPQSVQLYTGGSPRRLGGVELQELSGGDRDYVTDLRLTGNRTIHVEWISNRDTDYGCCGTMSLEADLTYDGRAVRASNVEMHDEVGFAEAAVDAVLAGEVSADEAVLTEMMTGPQIQGSDLTCLADINSETWPADVVTGYEDAGTWVTDPFGASTERGSRFCFVDIGPGAPAILGMQLDAWNEWSPASYTYPTMYR